MTRHTLRDLMICLQGAQLFLVGLFAFVGSGSGLTFAFCAWVGIYLLTPSRLPPRNERGQFSKRD